MSRSLRVLLLVLLLISAGCTAPFGGTNDGTASHTEMTSTLGETPSTTPTRTTDVTLTPTASQSTTTAANRTVTVFGSLPVDADRVWRRVQSLTGTDTRAPQVAVEMRSGGGRPLQVQGEFGAALGIGNVSSLEYPTQAGGHTRMDGRGLAITIVIGNRTTATSVERTLAHEYVHTIQQQTDWLAMRDRWYAQNLPHPRRHSHDTAFARWALLEGGAKYVEEAYAQQYLDGESVPPLSDRYQTATPGTKLFLGRYYFGSRYIASRIDSPRNISRVYETPPYTAEQVIHGYLPGEEPPTNLSVRLTDEAPFPATEEVMGEHFVRVALQVELNRSRAVDAAAGWGDDRLYGFQEDGQRGYVWVLDWDDEANATEFERAVRAYAAERPDGTRFAVERTQPTTVTVLVGPEPFVENTSVRVEDEDIVVSPPDW